MKKPKRTERDGTLRVYVFSMRCVFIFQFFFLRCLLRSRRQSRHRFPDDDRSAGRWLREQVDHRGSYSYGVGAVPRVDFILSSLLDKWLLLDSNSSTLSSAERSCHVTEERNGNEGSVK